MSIIGITMGCPVGIGPEIILKYFQSLNKSQSIRPIVIGDAAVLSHNAAHFGIDIECVSWQPGDPVSAGKVPVYSISNLEPKLLNWGIPNTETGTAMASYIESGVKLINNGIIDGITTCPIAKIALQQAGYMYPGHTEMLAALTGSARFAMMLAGKNLRVTLVTIHCSFTEVVAKLSQQSILDLIRTTYDALLKDFDIKQPRIGVAGLNPHAGENGIFGNEELEIIAPAVEQAQGEGIDVQGPFPPDTIFYQAARGKYHSVVCMYHDQGLIPFKLLHFSDGVNITLGLPIVRTSVDHGTAYDIAGKGVADYKSLTAAVDLAAEITKNRKKNRQLSFS